MKKLISMFLGQKESLSSELDKETERIIHSFVDPGAKVEIRDTQTGAMISAQKIEIEAIKVKNEIALQQTQALTSIAQSLSLLTNFLQNGGLTTLLQGYSKAQAVGGILQGLATHAGRNGLDARVLEQDAIEIVHKIEAVYKKYQERLEAETKGELDPDLHDAEDTFRKWVEKRNSREQQTP